jgi:hypothetical protein
VPIGASNNAADFLFQKPETADQGAFKLPPLNISSAQFLNKEGLLYEQV